MLTGFHISTTIFASGFATLCFIFVTKGKIPLYYGSSFSYIAAVVAVVGAEWGGVRVAQVGIEATAFVSIIAGLLIRWVGKEAIDKVLPPIVTGSVALVIGIALAKAALDMAAVNWGVAILTLVVTILFSVYLRGLGLLGMVPVLLGAVFGYLLSWALGIVDFSAVHSAAWFSVPKFSLPDFGNPNALKAVLAIAPIAIATIPESTAHLYQISLYIDRVAEDLGRPALKISRLIGLNLILDGIGDGINGLLGGCAGTNYGENNSLMAITRNYSVPVLMAAGVIAILLGFVGKLAGLVNTIPTAVTGGLSIYLFGVIGMQGVALIQSERVNLFEPRQLAVGSIILIAGIGGNLALKDGLFPFQIPVIFPNGIPAIVFAALVGILLNLVFLAVPPSRFGVKERENINYE